MLDWHLDTAVAQLKGPSCGIEVSSSRLPSFWFRVDSLEAVVGRIKALGGTAEEAFEGPHGMMCQVKDDQGVAFGISVHSFYYYDTIYDYNNCVPM